MFVELEHLSVQENYVGIRGGILPEEDPMIIQGIERQAQRPESEWPDSTTLTQWNVPAAGIQCLPTRTNKAREWELGPSSP